jgi:hypothetical protein
LTVNVRDVADFHPWVGNFPRASHLGHRSTPARRRKDYPGKAYAPLDVRSIMHMCAMNQSRSTMMRPARLGCTVGSSTCCIAGRRKQQISRKQPQQFKIGSGESIRR